VSGSLPLGLITAASMIGWQAGGVESWPNIE